MVQTVPSAEDQSAVSSEFDVYRLQLCPGKVSPLEPDSNTSAFTDVYEGPNTSHLVTNLLPNVQYSLRVSAMCSGENSTSVSWCPWSLPVTWATTLPKRGMCIPE